jgi:tetratricopeptide (TPR) repeat protein
MGKELIEKLLPNLQKMPVPESQEATPQGRQTYVIGLQKVDEYKGDTKTLVAALRIFQTCDSQPYAFGGVAYALVHAAREADGTYSEEGLDAAMAWLERAQEHAPNEVDINMIEAFVYIFNGRFEDARLVLDYLENIEPHNLYLMRAEIAYWEGLKELDEAIKWYKKAMDTADNVPQKFHLRNQMADLYLEHGEDDKALKIYQEAVHFSKEDPYLWHGISVVHYNRGDYKEAQKYNKLALDLQDFPDARQMEQEIKSKLGTGGLVSRLFGR